MSQQPLTFRNSESLPSLLFEKLCELPEDLYDSLKTLTFPSFRDKIRECLEGKRTSVLGSVALIDGQPVALALCEYGPGDEEGQLLSIAVKGMYRKRGVASRLLEELEKRACAAGIPRLSAVYTSALGSAEGIQSLLHRQGWSEPSPRVLFCRGVIQEMFDNAPWLNRIVCPPQFEIFEWADLNVHEKDQLYNDLEEGTVPEELSPFYDPELLELHTSVGVRHKGRVVGWQVNHLMRGEPGVMRYSRTFVYPEFQRTARGVILIKEAIVRQVERIKDSTPHYVCDVAYERPAMVRFYKRHLIPYSRRSYSSYGVFKDLH